MTMTIMILTVAIDNNHVNDYKDYNDYAII